jgi:ferredoxin
VVKLKESNHTLDFDEVGIHRLLSVNVGIPRDVTWNGKTVRTSIWKSPVTGRRTVRKLNIDCDAQADFAGHGGEQRAAFVYQMDSYHLQLAEACDVPVRWSCRIGICQPCMTGLIDGSTTYNPEPLDRPAPGNVLVCCSQPSAGVTLDL